MTDPRRIGSDATGHEPLPPDVDSLLSAGAPWDVALPALALAEHLTDPLAGRLLAAVGVTSPSSLVVALRVCDFVVPRPQGWVLASRARGPLLARLATLPHVERAARGALQGLGEAVGPGAIPAPRAAPEASGDRALDTLHQVPSGVRVVAGLGGLRERVRLATALAVLRVEADDVDRLVHTSQDPADVAGVPEWAGWAASKLRGLSVRYPWIAGDDAFRHAAGTAAGEVARFGGAPSAEGCTRAVRHLDAALRAALWLVQRAVEGGDPRCEGNPGRLAETVGPLLTGVRGAVLVGRPREAATLLARLLESLSDARGVSLAGLRLEGVHLDGVRWTAASPGQGGTDWPEGVLGRVRASSTPRDDGSLVVGRGTVLPAGVQDANWD